MACEPLTPRTSSRGRRRAASAICPSVSGLGSFTLASKSSHEPTPIPGIAPAAAGTGPLRKNFVRAVCPTPLPGRRRGCTRQMRPLDAEQRPRLTGFSMLGTPASPPVTNEVRGTVRSRLCLCQTGPRKAGRIGWLLQLCQLQTMPAAVSRPDRGGRSFRAYRPSGIAGNSCSYV